MAGVSARLAGAPALAVAEKVTEPIPDALATTRFVPETVPKVKRVEANPVLSVTALAGVTEPPPLLTAKVTVTPGSATPELFRSLTTSGFGKMVATIPL